MSDDKDVGHKAVQNTLKNMYQINMFKDNTLSGGYKAKDGQKYSCSEGSIGADSDGGSYGD